MITWSLKIIADKFLVILILLLISSIGRAIQLGTFGEISKGSYGMLEIPVEGSRILLILLLIGNGSIREGLKVTKVFHMEWGQIFTGIRKGIKEHYKELLLWLVLFVLTVFAINYLISKVSQNQDIIALMKQLAFLAPSFNSIALTLFLKNLTVIPLTFFFEVWFFLRMFNKV